MDYKLIITTCVALLRLCSNDAWAAPAITGVSGTVQDGQTVTISGSGFGATGPNVVLFDSFEKGTVSTNISTTSNSADVGNWNALSGGPSQTYSSDYALGGSKTMKIDWAASYGAGPRLRYSNVQNSDIFISWWQYLPTNRDIPGTNGEGANWKWFWIGDETDDWPWGSDYSIQCLSSTCDASTSIGSLDDLGAPARYEGKWYSTRFSKGTWMRVTVAIKNATSGGYAWQQEINGGNNSVVDSVTNVVTAHAGDSWNVLTLPGYGRQDSNAVAYYDDVYVATGDGARARVEIGNASTYTASTKLGFITPNSWSNSQINATVRNGIFKSGEQIYFFVIDVNGNPSPGFGPLNIGESSAGQNPISAPSPSGLTISPK